jgi:hypothetical protein
MNPTFRSIALKFAYALAASLVLGLSGWLQVNTDPGAWTIVSLKVALGTAVVAGIKKAIASVFTSE